MISFEERVRRITKRIPRGKVATYAGVARAMGRPRAVRAVGNALNKNPFGASSGLPAGRQVPCHRVVRADGRIGGYASGPKKKVALLTREGVRVEKGRVDLRRFGHRFR